MSRWDETPASRVLAGDLGAIASRYRPALVGFLQGVHRLPRAAAERID